MYTLGSAALIVAYRLSDILVNKAGKSGTRDLLIICDMLGMLIIGGYAVIKILSSLN